MTMAIAFGDLLDYATKTKKLDVNLFVLYLFRVYYTNTFERIGSYVF